MTHQLAPLAAWHALSDAEVAPNAVPGFAMVMSIGCPDGSQFWLLDACRSMLLLHHVQPARFNSGVLNPSGVLNLKFWSFVNLCGTAQAELYDLASTPGGKMIAA
jgi:hypothetical protein